MQQSSSLFLATAMFAALFCLSAIHSAEGIQCYVCSWSPTDANRADLCTRDKFSESVRTHSCDVGCETVTVYDKNGRLEFFYRNCAVNASSITGTCRNETSKAITKEICSCNSNYCNHSDGLEPQHVAVFLSIIAALLMLQF